MYLKKAWAVIITILWNYFLPGDSQKQAAALCSHEQKLVGLANGRICIPVFWLIADKPDSKVMVIRMFESQLQQSTKVFPTVSAAFASHVGCDLFLLLQTIDKKKLLYFIYFQFDSLSNYLGLKMKERLSQFVQVVFVARYFFFI